ncbi:MAG: Chorismate dehydratase [Candidatus Brocadiaceae bacterium]|nr:Chorismate dehydratase [Candidatus Brocadiaceae bacterium]
MKKRLRIGVVPYMNAKPLIYGLNQMSDAIELVFEVPSLLPDMLNNGHIDVSLIPSIEYFRNGGYAVIPGISISSLGTVESVKIFSKTPIRDIRTVALDKSSLTSCALTRIILHEKHHLSPQYTPWNGTYDIARVDADAALLIGDNAMRVKENGYFTFDHTGLPFVYAIWAVKNDSHVPGINNLLREAKEAGIQSVTTLAITESQRTQFTQEQCLRYLTHSIRYDLGDEEIKGFWSFYQQAVSLGLAPEGRKIVFNNT